jgi:hypothetical protein
MSLQSLVQALNGRRWRDSLSKSWAKSYVSGLTSELYHQDLQGLRCGFGLPWDEYEPEALALVAFLSGWGSWRVGDLTSDVADHLDQTRFEAALMDISAEDISELLVAIFTDAFSGHGGAAPDGAAALESLRQMTAVM